MYKEDQTTLPVKQRSSTPKECSFTFADKPITEVIDNVENEELDDVEVMLSKEKKML